MTVLETRLLNAGYGSTPIVSDVSLEFKGGQFIALAGPNGSGKSTLLKALAGLLRPQSGQICLDGKPLRDTVPRERAKHMAYMPPDGGSVWPLVAKRIVALGRAPHLKPLRDLSPDDEVVIASALDRAGVIHLAERSIDTLSSGEKARVMLARTLATGAKILLLDEPTAALDPRHQLAVMETLQAEAMRGTLVIIAAHTLDLVARYCDSVVLLGDGCVIAQGPPKAVLTESNMVELFGAAPPGGVSGTQWKIR
jgi:iron complex transport system ATP-binding protein